MASEPEQPDLPENDDPDPEDRVLDLINAHYRVGVQQLWTIVKAKDDDLHIELVNAAVERVIDAHVSWIDLLDLAEEAGLNAACDAHSEVCREYMTWRDEQEAAAPAEPEPKPKATGRRRQEG
jgi:hypothetical protein